MGTFTLEHFTHQLVIQHMSKYSKAGLVFGFFILLFNIPIRAQLYNQSWAYGTGGGVFFSPTGPQPFSVPTSLQSSEGCASICSPQTGQLMFYTNGVTVWNANGLVMQNGTGLLGGDPIALTSTAAAVIVPDPQNTNRYYIFCQDDFDGGNNGLTYSIVDMTLAGGLGAVLPTQKNIPLYANSTEKLTVAKKGCSDGYWILTAGVDGNSLAAFELDASGLTTTPVLSPTNAYMGTSGHIKVNPACTKFVVGNFFQNAIEIYNFNSFTGTISNLVSVVTGPILGANFSPWYGFEFSPDGNVLYAANTLALYQFNISSGNGPTILSTAVQLPVGSSLPAALQLGPDNLIYMNGIAFQIPNPNTPGLGCGPFVTIPNQSGGGGYGLPQKVLSLVLPTLTYSSPTYNTGNTTVQLPTNTSTSLGQYTSTPAGLNINSATGAVLPSSSQAGTYQITFTPSSGCTPITTTLTITSQNVLPSCDSSGNWLMYATYNGGKLNLVVDQNIPNLKIGICTYEPVQLTLSGPFVGNVTQVLYAGFNSAQNNNNCGFPITTTTITGVPTSVYSILTLPPVNIISPPNPNNILGLPNGNNTGIAALGSCDITTYQGGANTADQVLDYFLTQFGGTLRGYKIDNCCWLDSVPYRISAIQGACCAQDGGPTASISYPPGPFCAGQNLVVSPTITGNQMGAFVSTGFSALNPDGSVNLLNAQPGTYIIRYSFLNNCTPFVATDTLVISPGGGTGQPPQFSVDNTICTGGAVVNITPQTGFQTGGVFTSQPSGLSIDAASGSVNPALSSPGVYSITYSLPGNACAPAATFTLNNISVVTSSTAITAFSFPISTTCAGPITLQPQLSSVFTTGGTFSANNGLGINPQNGTVPLSTAAAGTYVVQYQYPNQTCVTGGTSTDTLTIIAPDTAKVGLSYTPIVCFGSTQVLLPQFQSGRTFGGTFGGATASALNPTTGAISVANLSPGSYTLSYSVADSTCRIGKIGQTGLQVVDTAVALDYAYGVLCSNLSSAAVQKGVGFTEGGFFRVTGLDIDSISGTLSFGRADTGVFDVRYVFAGNACQRSASENVSVEVINCDSTLREIFVPSAFSPNEDGSNDLLRVRGSIKTMKFQVFDRWGERVFFTEKQSLSWDGTYGGKPLDPAVFVYTLSATDILGANYDLKGTITLIR